MKKKNISVDDIVETYFFISKDKNHTISLEHSGNVLHGKYINNEIKSESTFENCSYETFEHIISAYRRAGYKSYYGVQIK